MCLAARATELVVEEGWEIWVGRGLSGSFGFASG
jgi:hypothetical protein